MFASVFSLCVLAGALIALAGDAKGSRCLDRSLFPLRATGDPASEPDHELADGEPD
jgi:hypothetical protein